MEARGRMEISRSEILSDLAGILTDYAVFLARSLTWCCPLAKRIPGQGVGHSLRMQGRALLESEAKPQRL